MLLLSTARHVSGWLRNEDICVMLLFPLCTSYHPRSGEYDSMNTRSLVGLLLAAVGMTGCGHQGHTRYRVTLVSDQPWTIGEA